MKFTHYFHHTCKRQDRKHIRMEWIERAVNSPAKETVQVDGRIRRWAWISEARKYLRVILLEDRETVHNAFFDRDFEENTNED
ncbi:MAG: hypothetical protein HUU46_14675 [Candidatus Hydrogenedentes bacterium]|nr:hypothetical protein [Candidatus Hydrogenedentota bacterium]